MARPRGFDETAVIRSAAKLFAGLAYDGVSIDELVSELGVHRNSLYKTFGSKRGLYLTALRWSLEHDVGPLITAFGESADPTPQAQLANGLDLLLLAAAEQAPMDTEVADEVNRALIAMDEAIGERATATVLGLRLRARFAAARESE
ncbi:TetR/AcrR family transcriptional regulator [Nocardia sp. NEAU-G5]|uniref:TetR/AcrR family transcriptional regulator n=1 Tax=Nocardia albiluteola TaxID=2842303 RepID=A0ABS6AT93_9NOCA|nr:TetR/AcrR family transcriptional regulator [Nocardia albiluteola]MBU3060461.1 TetR/AcrR family transcriptional regulator [Nocardia albiluteola]